MRLLAILGELVVELVELFVVFVVGERRRRRICGFGCITLEMVRVWRFCI